MAWQFLKNVWSAIPSRIRFDSVEQQAFCLSSMQDYQRQQAFLGIAIGVVYHGLSIFTDQLLIRSDIDRQFLFWIHVVYLGSILLFQFFERHLRIGLLLFVIFGQYLTITGYMQIFYDQITHPEQATYISIIKSWSAYLGIGIFLILLLPYYNWVDFAYATTLLIVAAIGWSNYPDGHQMIGISALAFYTAVYFHRGHGRSVLEEAKREFNARRALEEAQRANFEQQIKTAREIQESIAPPTSYRAPGIGINFFQRKHEGVGGDWMALREDADGRVIVAVGDAAGKGIQAALVVHAVQALWSEALAYEKFRADGWLRRVNDALWRLGQRTPHTMTMGILIISREGVEYHNAGHLPAIVFREDLSDETRIQTFSARGGVLGISEKYNATSGFIPRRDLSSIRLVLGTDGALPKGSGHSKRDLFALDQALKMGADGLDAISQAEDDRTLVCVNLDFNRFELSAHSDAKSSA